MVKKDTNAIVVEARGQGGSHRTVVKLLEDRGDGYNKEGSLIDVTSDIQPGVEVGTKGVVRYLSGAGFGLFIFRPYYVNPLSK